MQEVSRAHSTRRKDYKRNPKLQKPYGKEQIHYKKLPFYYVSGFIDGEGSFSVGIGKHKTTRRKVDVRLQFEIELRADEREILERILITIGCGKIYDCSYDRYGWYPHLKYKITNTIDMEEYLVPFLDKYPLQAKKAETYKFFKEALVMFRKKEHLTDAGFERILQIREEMRALGKKAKTHNKAIKLK